MTMPHSTQPHEDAIRALAHAYWESEGRPEGRAEIHWQRAIDALNDHVEVQPLPQAQHAASTDEAPMADSQAAATDISLIDGIGPKITAMLHDAGITSLQQIAAMTSEEMAALDERLELRGRSAREAWVEQAQELVAGLSPRAEVDRNHLADNAA
jgi:predicted flap endonuclease-1-like 5' DNA nuclease